MLTKEWAKVLIVRRGFKTITIPTLICIYKKQSGPVSTAYSYKTINGKEDKLCLYAYKCTEGTDYGGLGSFL